MNSPIEDLKDYLEDNSSLVFKEDIFLSVVPEVDGLIVALFDSTGSEPEPTGIRHPVVQVVVRGVKGEYQDAYGLMETVLGVFHGISNTTINGTNYIIVWKINEIGAVGRDKNGRPILSCSLRIQRSA